jgi:hypothetical protein
MQFYRDVRKQLEHRQGGFDYIFNYLEKINEPLIVETGCAREENNYAGDGQSSLLFDKFINEYGGEFCTVDISPESVAFCRSKMVCERSKVIESDSITYLKQLNLHLQETGQKIDFLYLDSFDAPADKPDVVAKSALHHLYELTTILPSLKNGALIAVDDCWLTQDDKISGKGSYVTDYMYSVEKYPIYMGYQMIWKY